MHVLFLRPNTYIDNVIIYLMNFLGSKNKGFTLIELLVVIAIIGLLSSVVIASLSSARIKARDARRKSDLRQIQKAVELYYDKYGTYKIKGSGFWGGTVGTFEDSSCGCGFFSVEKPAGPDYQRSIARALYEEGLTNSIIRDPSGKTSGSATTPFYMYYTTPDGQKYSITAYLEGDINEDVSYCASSTNWSYVSGTWLRNYCVAN